MNVLDENIVDSERRKLKKWRIPVRQIGHEVGRAGMQDADIIPLLHELSGPTFFTRDRDFCNSKLCHPRYCLVFLDVEKTDAAGFIRRVLHHPDCDTKAARLGTVLHATYRRLIRWESFSDRPKSLLWKTGT